MHSEAKQTKTSEKVLLQGHTRKRDDLHSKKPNSPMVFREIELFGFVLAVLGVYCCSRVAGGGGLLLWFKGFSLWWFLLLQSTGSRALGLQ